MNERNNLVPTGSWLTSAILTPETSKPKTKVHASTCTSRNQQPGNGKQPLLLVNQAVQFPQTPAASSNCSNNNNNINNNVEVRNNRVRESSSQFSPVKKRVKESSPPKWEFLARTPVGRPYLESGYSSVAAGYSPQSSVSVASDMKPDFPVMASAASQGKGSGRSGVIVRSSNANAKSCLLDVPRPHPNQNVKHSRHSLQIPDRHHHPTITLDDTPSPAVSVITISDSSEGEEQGSRNITPACWWTNINPSSLSCTSCRFASLFASKHSKRPLVRLTSSPIVLALLPVSFQWSLWALRHVQLFSKSFPSVHIRLEKLGSSLVSFESGFGTRHQRRRSSAGKNTNANTPSLSHNNRCFSHPLITHSVSS